MKKASSPERTDWARVLIILGASILATCQIGKAPPSLPMLRLDLNMTLFAAGWVISIFNIIGLLGGALAGAIADRLGHRRMVIYGLIVLGLGSFAGSMAPSAAILLASRFFEGFGLMILMVAAPTLIIRSAGTDHVRMIMGFWSCSIPAGMSLMMLVSSVILAFSTWRSLWLTNAVLLFMYALFFSILTREPATRPSRQEDDTIRIWRDIKKIASKPGPILLGLCYATFSFQHVGFMGFLPTMLIEDLGTGPSAAALLTAAVVATNILGNLLSGYLLQRGIKRVVCLIAASGLMGAFAFGIYTGFLPGPVRVGFCFLFSGVSGMIPAAVFAGAMVHAPSPSLVGTTNGLVMQLANLGPIFGPPLIAAAVTAAGGWQVVPWVLVSAAISGIAFSLGLGWLEARKRERA